MDRDQAQNRFAQKVQHRDNRSRERSDSARRRASYVGRQSSTASDHAQEVLDTYDHAVDAIDEAAEERLHDGHVRQQIVPPQPKTQTEFRVTNQGHTQENNF